MRPADAEIARAFRLLGPWRRLTRPVFEGLDRIPDERPLLFVGNHTLFGILDIPLLAMEVHARRGILLRGLADHLHYAIPGWRSFLTRCGVVDGTPENCAELMRAGEAVLVFPGGAREVAKRRGEAYRLIWKERVGFARLAIEHGATVVPFAEVGAEDMFRIVVDGDDVLASPLGALWRRFDLRTDFIPPIALGPRPQRFYFHVGEPICSVGHTPESLRDATRAAVEAGITRMLAVRAADPLRRLRARIGRGGKNNTEAAE